jgi:hypothetical protein
MLDAAAKPKRRQVDWYDSSYRDMHRVRTLVRGSAVRHEHGRGRARKSQGSIRRAQV